MNLEYFLKNSKSVRFENRIQHTSSFSHSRYCGFDYYVYLCQMTFETFNPFTKKHEGRPYKIFFSSVSADHAKEQAFNYIVQQTGVFSGNEH